MAICLTFGEQTFRSQVPGYEGRTVRCFNCGNYSGRVLKSHSFVTICFIPLIPLSFHAYKDVICDICHFAQPLESRPDVTGQGGGPGMGPPGPVQGPGPGYYGSPPPQGWGHQPPGNQEQMRYG